MVESGLGVLFGTYIRDAAPFAVVHAVLLVACLRIWVSETLRIRTVRKQLDSAKAGSHPESETTLGQAFDYAVGLAAKGRLVDPGSLHTFLRNAWHSSDSAFHAFLNAFVISGILGTLYNLWRVRAVLQQIVSSGATAQSSVGIVGVAFTASIFGLAFALILGAADALFFQPRRNRLMEDVVGWLTKETVDRTPLSAEAILARSIDDLREFNKEVIQGVAAGLERLAREYATRFDGLATKAKTDMDGITAEWSQTLKSSRKTLDTAAGKVSQASDRLDARRESIETALKTVGDAQATLIDSVGSVQKTVTGLLKETNSQVKQSSEAWQKITAAHEGRVTRLHDGIKHDAGAGVQAIATAADEAIRKIGDRETALVGTATGIEEALRKEAGAGIQALAAAANSALKTVADSASLNTAVESMKEKVAGVIKTARTELDTIAPAPTRGPLPPPFVTSGAPPTAAPTPTFGSATTQRNNPRPRSPIEVPNRPQRHDSIFVRAARKVAEVIGLG